MVAERDPAWWPADLLKTKRDSRWAARQGEEQIFFPLDGLGFATPSNQRTTSGNGGASLAGTERRSEGGLTDGEALGKIARFSSL